MSEPFFFSLKDKQIYSLSLLLPELPGGLIVIVMRYEYLTVGDEHHTMEPLMIELEERHGLWQRVKRQISPNYLLDKEGIIFAYRKSSS